MIIEDQNEMEIYILKVPSYNKTVCESLIQNLSLNTVLAKDELQSANSKTPYTICKYIKYI